MDLFEILTQGADIYLFVRIFAFLMEFLDQKLCQLKHLKCSSNLDNIWQNFIFYSITLKFGIYTNNMI